MRTKLPKSKKKKNQLDRKRDEEILLNNGVKPRRRKYATVVISDIEKMIGYYQSVNDDYSAGAMLIAAQSFRIPIREEAIAAFKNEELSRHVNGGAM